MGSLCVYTHPVWSGTVLQVISQIQLQSKNSASSQSIPLKLVSGSGGVSLAAAAAATSGRAVVLHQDKDYAPSESWLWVLMQAQSQENQVSVSSVRDCYFAICTLVLVGQLSCYHWQKQMFLAKYFSVITFEWLYCVCYVHESWTYYFCLSETSIYLELYNRKFFILFFVKSVHTL